MKIACCWVQFHAGCLDTSHCMVFSWSSPLLATWHWALCNRMLLSLSVPRLWFLILYRFWSDSVIFKLCSCIVHTVLQKCLFVCSEFIMQLCHLYQHKTCDQVSVVHGLCCALVVTYWTINMCNLAKPLHITWMVKIFHEGEWIIYIHLSQPLKLWILSQSFLFPGIITVQAFIHSLLAPEIAYESWAVDL